MTAEIPVVNAAMMKSVTKESAANPTAKTNTVGRMDVAGIAVSVGRWKVAALMTSAVRETAMASTVVMTGAQVPAGVVHLVPAQPIDAMLAARGLGR